MKFEIERRSVQAPASNLSDTELVKHIRNEFPEMLPASIEMLLHRFEVRHCETFHISGHSLPMRKP